MITNVLPPFFMVHSVYIGKMAGTVISAKYPPQIDPTRTTLAYGNRALPRLVSNWINCLGY